jgi:hypothetical protein
MRAKITADHLERTALVYVRQSMPDQVRDHTESRRRQYGLVDVARELGFRRVETIDDDLGISGSGFAERPGVQRLLTTVCAGTAVAGLALEASRLARNERDCDWSQLWWYLRSGSAIWLPSAPSGRTALNHVIADRAIADDGSSGYAWAMPGASSRE